MSNRRHVAAIPLGLALFAAGCAAAPASTPDPAPPATANPAFVDALIAGFEAEPVANPPAAIFRYRYRGQDVWYVPPRCCDIPGEVYTADGEKLCEPDGGFTGNGDGQCTDFHDARSDERLVWRDPRR